jgi:hypothetical protein
MSWVGADVGWALTAHGCGNGRSCAELDETTDAAIHWHREQLPREVAHLRATVFGIAFNRHDVGYLYGNPSWVTRDGARTWHRVPGATLTLVIDGSETYRVTYHHDDCPAACHPAVQAAATGTASFRTIYPPSDFGFGEALAASDARILVTYYGHPGGGAPAAGAVYGQSSDAGRTWTQRPDACGGQGESEQDTGTVFVDRSHVDVSCQRRHPPNTWTLLQSTNGGRTFTGPRRVPFPPAAIARVGRSILIASTVLGGRNGDHYQVAISGNSGHHWHDVLYRSAQPSDYDEDTATMQCVQQQCAYVPDPTDLLVSLNGGRTWAGRTP